MDTETPDFNESPAALRQAARLEDVPELYRKKHERLAVELALHVDDAAEIFASYGYNGAQAAELLENPTFVLLMQQAQRAVVEEGLSFKMKAKLIAGELLPYAHDLATDPLISAAVRMDAIKWAASVAGFAKEAKEEGKDNGGLTLTIQFAGAPPSQVISAQHTPLTITQEP